MQEYTYQEKVRIKRGFYRGYKAIVIGESKAIDGSKNYTVKVKIPDERDKEVTLPSEDLKPLKWYDF